MKIHEYQARALLEEAGAPVPPGTMVESAEEAIETTRHLLESGASVVVIKAQVHAGGRGKAGFVKLVHSVDEAFEAAAFMLSHRMISPQTPPEGLQVTRLLVTTGVAIEAEYYLAVTLDRSRGTNVLIASAEGGVEIEQVAANHPEKIIKEPLDPLLGLQPWQARKVAFSLGFKGKQVAQATKTMLAVAKMAISKDASMVEINPLVVTKPDEENPDGLVLAIDAKVSFDDNALFRQKEIASLEENDLENKGERNAVEYGLSYVALDGNIGCLVNGAGLAMSTMDIIKLHGGEPANFLDVGGSATEETVTEAFRIILADDKVKGVLVNIFGGIMQCDTIAKAIVNAAQVVGFDIPLVVRLEGTNVEAAREILRAAKKDIPSMNGADDLAEAAKAVCSAVTVTQ